MLKTGTETELGQLEEQTENESERIQGTGSVTACASDLLGFNLRIAAFTAAECRNERVVCEETRLFCTYNVRTKPDTAYGVPGTQEILVGREANSTRRANASE